jgi:sodium transport system permease protein
MRPSSLRGAFVVFRKEWRDALRDRRSLVSVGLGSLVGPVLVVGMLHAVADWQREVETMRLPIAGRENALALVEWLDQQEGIEVVDAPSDPERAIRERDEDLVIIIPSDYAEHFVASKPAKVRLLSDGARNSARPKVERVRGMLARYGAEIGSLRLIARGVSPQVAMPVDIDDVELSSAQERAASILGFVPLFVMLAAFTGGMQIATDSTAGERERGSLEALLVTPASRVSIAAGKWLAATALSAASVVLTAVLCTVALSVLPLAQLGMRFRFDLADLAVLLAAALPLCPLAASIELYLSTFARSFKEAQTYMGLLLLVPMLPGVLSMVRPFGAEAWMYPLPFVGHHALLNATLGGQAPVVLGLLISAVTSLLVSVLLVERSARLLARESIVFGR